MFVSKDPDGYGALLLTALDTNGKGVAEISERDDGFIAATDWPRRYFSGQPGWTKRERQAIQLVKGRVLDIGCGAGRFALHLQRKGHEVTGIDSSRGAVQVCKLRGVRRVLLRPIEEIGTFAPASFDTVIMMGNNFGLFASFTKAKRLLAQLHEITSPHGQIIAEAVDPYQTNDSWHLDYQRRNRARGRMSGQLKIRIRHQRIIGTWFDYLLVSRKEMEAILDGTGWQIGKMLSEQGGKYTAVLNKA
jgi:SAM-dependent methyltransferase